MALASLAACDSIGSDDRICTHVPPLDVSPEAMGRAAGGLQDLTHQTVQLDQCVHRWAYRLARASDPAHDVADAVLGACSDLILRTGYAKELDRRRREESMTGFDAFTGQEINLYEQTTTEARRKALFHVVQARAGKCPVPG